MPRAPSVAVSGSALELIEAAAGVAVTGEASHGYPPTSLIAGRRAITFQSATSRRELLRDSLGYGSSAPYGVRSAVTSRASRITVLEPATRRQEASKFGQACREQSGPTGRISSRSPLARANGTLASTCGAKPGRMVSAAATNAAIAMAEIALIMTVPCHGPLRPVVFVRLMDTQRPFPDVFAGVKNGFIRPEFCFVAVGGKKHGRPA